MKKTILIAGLALAAFIANAQLKVYSGGKTFLGGTSTTPLSFLSIGGAGNTAIMSYVYQATAGSSYAGFKSEAVTGASSGYNAYGVIGNVTPSTQTTYGVQGSSYSASTTTGSAIGVYGLAGNATDGSNYGVWGRLYGTRKGAAIYGSYGAFSTLDTLYAGYFEGKIRTTNSKAEKPGGGSWSGISDMRLKKNITNFNDGIEVLRKIRPVNYQYNGMGGLPVNQNFIGVIAQDVQKVAPYCVGKTGIVVNSNEKSNFGNDIVETLKNDTTGDKYIAEILSFNQDGLFWAMVNSIKQLDSTVTDLQSQLKAASGQRTNNSGLGQKESTLQIELANKSNVILYQNEPNPFDGSTVIRYFIPENIAGNSFVIFCDMYGKEVNRLEIKEKGFGKIEANTENLASGIYSYSIIVNDKTIDTKKMLKNK